MLFYVAIHHDDDSAYGVTVPSIEGCFSAGDTLDEAIFNTKEAIQFHLEGMLEDGIEPHVFQEPLNSLQNNPDYAEAQWFGLEVDISNLTLKPERFNVSWPKYLLDKVDIFVAQNHDNRSNFLAKAALEKMNH